MESVGSAMEVDTPHTETTLLPSTTTKTYIEQIYSNIPKKCFEGIVELKFSVIGSPRAKAHIIEQGCVARLLQILRAPDSGLLLKTEVVTVLNSLAKGLPEHTASLVQAGILPVLWEQLEACGHCNSNQLISVINFKANDSPVNLSNNNGVTAAENSTSENTNLNDMTSAKMNRVLKGYTEILLCCLRSVHRQGCVPLPPLWNSKLLSTLIKYGYSPPINQECVANILAYACKSAATAEAGDKHVLEEQQVQLVSAGAGTLVASMLCSNLVKVQLPALHCLTALIKNNKEVSQQVYAISRTDCDGSEVLIADRLVQLLRTNSEPAVQLAAASGLVWLHRGDAIPSDDPRICNLTMQSLITLTNSDYPGWLRVEAARLLAHLTELSPELQRVASITDHVVTYLKQYINYTPDENEPLPRPEQLSPSSVGQFDDRSMLHELMREAGLLAFATLIANNEDIRQKVITAFACTVPASNLLEVISKTLSGGASPAVQMAAIRCLHSLSRSVHTLRTTFQDYTVWRPLLLMIQDPKCDDEMVVLALSTLCNLSLEFSPSKEQILEEGCIQSLCKLTKSDNNDIRLNAVWALMNIAFQADPKVKDFILVELGTTQVFNLVSSGDTAVVMKSLGLLRNLISNKQYIDVTMRIYGTEIMQSIILILEGHHNVQVKEQALCLLANIADGVLSKSYILGNEDVLKKLFNYMGMSQLELQLAATCCIGNLSASDDRNHATNIARLKELKTEKVLHSLLSTQDPNLYDKVKYALDQFKAAPSTGGNTSTTSAPPGGNGGSSVSSGVGTPAHWRPMDQGQ